MAHSELYEKKSSWDGTWAPPMNLVDLRDARDPEQIGLALRAMRKRGGAAAGGTPITVLLKEAEVFGVVVRPVISRRDTAFAERILKAEDE